jgi:hypothetical protein
VSIVTLRISSAAKEYPRREYTKKEAEQLDVIIKDIQADLKRVQLLQILGQQLELLINEGQPDLHSLFTSLKAEHLVSEEEYTKLRVTFSLETVSSLIIRHEEARIDLVISI